MTKKEAVLIAHFMAIAIQEYGVPVTPEDLALLNKNPIFAEAYTGFVCLINEDEEIDREYDRLMTEKYGPEWMLLNEAALPSKAERAAIWHQAEKEIKA